MEYYFVVHCNTLLNVVLLRGTESYILVLSNTLQYGVILCSTEEFCQYVVVLCRM